MSKTLLWWHRGEQPAVGKSSSSLWLQENSTGTTGMPQIDAQQCEPCRGVRCAQRCGDLTSQQQLSSLQWHSQQEL